MSHAAEPGLAAFNTRYPLRRILILIAAFAAPIVGYGQMALGLGQSPSEFSADGDQTLRVAGYAFSIWAVIYAWLIAYGVYQALPATSESDTARRLGWPSFAALTGIALWVIASAADWEWLTVVLIVGSLAAVLIPLLQLPHDDPIKRRALIVWPLAMLAGWLTIASLVNLLTVLTSQGVLTPDTALPVALVAVIVAVVAALLVTARTRADLHDVTGCEFRCGDFDDPAIAADPCGAWLQAHQTLDRLRGAALGFRFEIPAEQDQRDDDRRRFVVNIDRAGGEP